jgi:acetyl esterase/lipase
VPIGYLITVLIAAVCTALAIRPPHPRRSGPFRLSYWLSYQVNEVPFLVFYWLLAATLLAYAQGDIGGAGGWAVVGLAVLTCVGLADLVRRALLARPAVDRALADALGTADRPRHRLPWGRILFAPWRVRHRDVEHLRDISYGPAGQRNLLDVYRHRSHPADAPTVVYFHGGSFRSGRKHREARPLLYRLASHGWVCISANYRLSPPAVFPDHLVDVKRVIAWAREHGPDYGVDPRTVFVAGSSAGGHLATMAALTSGHPEFQPGFETADTSVCGAISLYGYYGGLDGDPASVSSPATHLHADAPPFFAAHGDQDTIVIVEDARRFVAQLRAASANPVVYAELPGGQHSFDLFHSIRFEIVVDGVEDFAASVRSRAD